MTERDFPEMKFCDCDICRQCFFNDEYLEINFQNDGVYVSLENTVYLTGCAKKSPFNRNMNTINHEYFHWVMDKLFPDEKYTGLRYTDMYSEPDEIECDYHSIPDTPLWNNVEVSLGHRYKDFRNPRWPPTKIDVWNGMIASVFDWWNLTDARLWFK